MPTYKKELVLIYRSDQGQQTKIKVSYFLADLNPEILVDHATLLPISSSSDQIMSQLEPFYCIHAHYVETNQRLLFLANRK